MKGNEVPWSHIFWGIGFILILRSCYDKQIGIYYTGSEISTYSDTLKEKIWYSRGGKGVSNKYHIRLAYSKSKFIIADNGCDIITRDENKKDLITSLSPGDLITISFESFYEDQTNNGRNTVKIIGISGNGTQILSAEEVRMSDRKDIRNWNIGGIVLIALGGVAYYIRKRRK